MAKDLIGTLMLLIIRASSLREYDFDDQHCT